ncbi:MAG: hypothetical protein R3B72_13875 [Polyangiaceae bacterium]
MREIESLTALDELLASAEPLVDVVFQGLDLRGHTAPLRARQLGRSVVFLGCRMEQPLERHAIAEGALVFPIIEGLPFHPYRAALYQVEELYDAFDWHEPESYRRCLDARVYEHWRGTGRDAPDSILETLARRLHDHAISDAVEELVVGYQVVAIMGGHGLPRGRGEYAAIARIARRLSAEGFLLASGGGPGAMEATHVGAWFVDRPEAEMLEAIDLLARAPRYDDRGWLSRAFEVRERWPLAKTTAAAHPSLGIPTWLYGHEPPNAFATHVAKYFANSVREEGLLALAKAGVVFAPGSAGTIQEVFQDACQNHYESMGGVSPMIFLGVDYWTCDKPVYPLLRQLADGRRYAAWLSITDHEDEVVTAILAFRDRPR